MKSYYTLLAGYEFVNNQVDTCILQPVVDPPFSGHTYLPTNYLPNFYNIVAADHGTEAQQGNG